MKPTEQRKRRGPAPGTRKEPVAVRNAHEAWGRDLPDWVDVLAQECDRPGSSMAAVGKAVGYSAGVLSSIFRNKYPGDMARVERSVRGAFMGDTVQCPVLGSIPVNECLQHQASPLVTSNRQRIELWQNCNGAGRVRVCPHSSVAKGSDHAE